MRASRARLCTTPQNTPNPTSLTTGPPGIAIAHAVAGADMNRNLLRPSSTVRASVGDDGLVLLDLRGGLVLSANAVGGRIWKLIEQRRSRDDIAGQLVADFAVDCDRAARDVDRFVTDLLARGLVTEA